MSTEGVITAFKINTESISVPRYFSMSYILGSCFNVSASYCGQQMPYYLVIIVNLIIYHLWKWTGWRVYTGTPMAPNQCQPTLGPIIATLNQGPISQRIYELIIQIFKKYICCSYMTNIDCIRSQFSTSHDSWRWLDHLKRNWAKTVYQNVNHELMGPFCNGLQGQVQGHVYCFFRNLTTPR